MEELNTLANSEQQFSAPEPIAITNRAVEFLDKTSKWSKFISIIGFISCAFMFLAGVVAIIAASFIPETAQAVGAFIAAIFYFGIGALSLFPSLYLYRFSDKIFYAIRERDNELLETSFENIMRYFKFTSIMYIAGFGLGIIALIIGFIVAMVGGFHIPKVH